MSNLMKTAKIGLLLAGFFTAGSAMADKAPVTPARSTLSTPVVTSSAKKESSSGKSTPTRLAASGRDGRGNGGGDRGRGRDDDHGHGGRGDHPSHPEHPDHPGHPDHPDHPHPRSPH